VRGKEIDNVKPKQRYAVKDRDIQWVEKKRNKEKREERTKTERKTTE